MLSSSFRSSHVRVRVVADHGHYRSRPIPGHLVAYEAEDDASARTARHDCHVDIGVGRSRSLRHVQPSCAHFHVQVCTVEPTNSLDNLACWLPATQI